VTRALKCARVGDIAHRHTNLADFADGHRVVRVVPCLRRQIEGDAQPRLALGEILPKQLIRHPWVGMCYLRINQGSFVVRHELGMASRRTLKQPNGSGCLERGPLER